MAESFDDFRQRMKCPHVYSPKLSRYVFSNGAQSNGHRHIDPPTDSLTMLRIQREYLDGKIVDTEQKLRDDTEPKVESELAFTARQNCPRVMSRSRWLYQNGAQWTGFAIDPPDDLIELQKLRIEYLEANLTIEQKRLDQCQSYITVQAQFHQLGSGPLPEPEAFDDRDKFQNAIRVLEMQLDESREGLRRLTGPTPGEIYQAKRDRQRNDARDVIDRLRGVYR